MPDPITIGSLVAAAMAMAADASVKGTVGEAAKDAYHALKNKISQWASGDVQALEKTPSSATRQAVIAEIIDAQSNGEQELLRSLAKALVAELKRHSQVIGVDLGRLTDVEVQLGSVSVTEGTGVRIDRAQGGTIRTGDITVGHSALKK